MYIGPIPWPLLLMEAALVYVAALLAAWNRKKLAFAATLSLAAAVGITALWVRGARSGDTIHLNRSELRTDRVTVRNLELISASGGFKFARVEQDISIASGMLESRDAVWWERQTDRPSYPFAGPLGADDKGSVHTWHGFELQSRISPEFNRPTKIRDASVTFPDWCPLAVLGLFPVMWLARGVHRLRSRRRRRRGHCAACGYNLTGNTSGVCPECGVKTRQILLLEPAGAGELRE